MVLETIKECFLSNRLRTHWVKKIDFFASRLLSEFCMLACLNSPRRGIRSRIFQIYLPTETLSVKYFEEPA